MNGTSNAKVLNERVFERQNRIVRVNYAHKRNMMKQRMCGVLLLAVLIFAVSFAEDMELILAAVPAALYLIFTKKTILSFECE